MLAAKPFYLSCIHIGVELISDTVTTFYGQATNRVDDDTWPPGQSHYFTPLLLVHHEGGQMRQALEIAKMIHKGNFTSEKLTHTELDGHVPNVSKVTKDVREILFPLEESYEPRFVMVEGAPGIGKSVLLREIAYRWGKKQWLQTFELLLLICLRDPIVQKATTVKELLLSFCEGDRRAQQIADACSDYFFKKKGKNLIFLFDGFDEFPEHLQKQSFISKIINRKILPLCGLVVSSRPHASVTFQHKATITVDILGFTEEERYHYIEHCQSLKQRPQSIEKLTQYLQDNVAISNLCLLPFHLVILIFLYEKGYPLPSNPSKLYHLFICLTICRHLAKHGHPLESNINQLSELTEPYSKILKQLSKLALHAINKNKLVFTYEEIQNECPDIIATPEAINGFGLLQAVQHYGLTRKTTTFNFLHLTIQEYLAAHHIITDLHPDEEFYLLQKHFWSDLHINMFAIYITLTAGQRSPFKKFLSDGYDKTVISSKFLCDQLKSMRLFYFLRDAKDDHMYKLCIEETTFFTKKEISLRGIPLSNTDLECVSFFLTSSSNKKWTWLELDKCSIHDSGLYILYKYLSRNVVTITKLWLDYNDLTKVSSSFIRDIVLCCKVKQLSISGNSTVGEGNEFYTILTHHSSILTKLLMTNASLSSDAARNLFTAVKNSINLKVLDIRNSGITDDVADDITRALTVNNTLVQLWMSNPISGKAILQMLHALHSNKTLQYLYISSYSTVIQHRIRSIENELNIKRTSQGMQLLHVYIGPVY